MFKISLVLFLTLVAANHGRQITKINLLKLHINPYNIHDEASETLEKLKVVLAGAIQTAEFQLDSAQTGYTAYESKIENEAEVKIKDESNRIAGLINDMKTLAQTANVNINVCLQSYPEDLVNTTINALASCIFKISLKVETELDNTKKTVEDTNETVNELSTKLAACVGDNIICISPVLRSIQQAVIELPESIDKNVHSAVDLVDTLTPEVDQCSSSLVTNYVSNANAALDQINSCVSNLM